MNDTLSLISEITTRLGNSSILQTQSTADGTLTVWVKSDQLKELLRFLKNGITQPFSMLYDLTAIDERRKSTKQDTPESDFTVVYHLLSLERNEDIRIKVPLTGEYPEIISITDIWPLQTGMSAKFLICSELHLPDIRIYAGYFCPSPGKDIRSERNILPGQLKQVRLSLKTR